MSRGGEVDGCSCAQSALNCTVTYLKLGKIAVCCEPERTLMNLETEHTPLSPVEEAPSSARERVLLAAEKLFMERGYAAITLRDIATALDIRQASLYYHFPAGKEQLFVAVVETTFARHGEGIRAAVATSEVTLEAQLNAVAIWFTGQPSFNLLGMMHADMPALSRKNREHLFAAASTAIFLPIRSLFEDAAMRQEIRPIPFDLVTGAFLSILDGIRYWSAQEVERGNLPSSKEMAQEMIRVLLDGMRTARVNASPQGAQ